jgi:uncharacterized protein YqhQ
VLIFAPFKQLSLVWRLTTRLLLLPVIAGISYEFIRWTARFSDRRWMQVLVAPNLVLQRLTTNEPDDAMIEVAIEALTTVLSSERQPVAGAVG